MTRKSDKQKPIFTVSIELERLVTAIRAGRLDERASLNGQDAESEQILRLANTLVDELVHPLRVAAGSLAEIAAGNIPEFVIDDYQGEFDTIKRNINNFLATMQGMHHEAQDLISAITSGRLHARGNAWDFEGTWRELISGMNGVVDAFERPFQIASGCVREISDGKMPPPISQRLKGEYGRLAHNLNDLSRTVRHMTNAVAGLCESAVGGKLDQRISEEQFAGDWQTLVRSINETLDAALAPIQEAGEVLEQIADYDLRVRVEGDYAGDHARIKDALNVTAENLNQAMLQVSGSTEAVAKASHRIASAAQAVTLGTERQVSAVDSITNKTANLLKQAEGNAALSQNALSRTREVNSSVDTGKASADRVATVMADVVAATEASTAVIQEIDAIAIQTDTLAITANAEAGKVASSGRGFAVVADEVRRLAQQSKDAANKIDSLLIDIGKLLASVEKEGRSHTKDAIASIVQEIQQIAFQTNLLAVNAAVEAAHVAAASSGFEAITGEIRGLAHRVKGAAERTRTLTQGAHGAAEGGRGIATELGKDFEDIVASVSCITESIETIAAATNDQQQSMRTMAEAMNAIQEVTDNNARSAAGSSTDANSLTRETAALAQLVRRFKLGDLEVSRERGPLPSTATTSFGAEDTDFATG
jgi:methyl-accepting chemotaxis protein